MHLKRSLKESHFLHDRIVFFEIGRDISDLINHEGFRQPHSEIDDGFGDGCISQVGLLRHGFSNLCGRVIARLGNK